MRFEGQIIKHFELDCFSNQKIDSKKLLFDAEPHVMQRVRKIFDNHQNFWSSGKYTHKPIVFPLSNSSCKDLVWLMDRYNLEVEKELLNIIIEKSNQYDRIIKFVSDADKDTDYKISDRALKLALPLRTHQIQFNNMFSKVKKMLLGDKLGLGKTSSAISILCEPERRPALIVVPTTLCSQWDREVNRFLPDASRHVIKGFKNYDLSKVDVIITSYNRLQPWQDILLDGNKFKTIIFDEVHELRHTSTGKREISKKLSEKTDYCVGLSATPIFNMGNEIWSVLDVIKPDCLGDSQDFESEWCTWGKVNEPSTLNHYLKQQGLFLRRSSEEVGLKFGEVSKHIFTIDSDLEKLKEIQDVAKMLAISILSGSIGEDSESAREFDWKLRHATGVAKAKPVSDFVKMLVESGEKIVLAGWHRDVYEVWQKELAQFNPVMFTGSETSKEKDQSVNKFINGDAKVFIISLRSGAGLDGLQNICSTVVFGELDWTSNVHDQVIGRLARDGQMKHVNAYFLTIPDGSDPFIINSLGIKKSQHDGLVEGKQSEGGIITQSSFGKDRIKNMASEYLKSIGEEIPEPVTEEGLLAEVSDIIRKTKLPMNSEEEMQEALNNILLQNIKNAKVEREYKIGKRSRLDFLIHNENNKLAVECKINQTKRTEVYRQVRKYIEECKIDRVILVAPWYGINSFKVDGIPVVVIDTNINSI